MALPWVRLDSQWASNPKVLDLVSRKKHRAIVVWLASLGYSGAHGTDGFIPNACLPFLHANQADSVDLVMVRLWHCTEGGWRINDWDEYQYSSEELGFRRSELQSAAKKGNCVRWHGKDCGCWKHDRNGHWANR